MSHLINVLNNANSCKKNINFNKNFRLKIFIHKKIWKSINPPNESQTMPPQTKIEILPAVKQIINFTGVLQNLQTEVHLPITPGALSISSDCNKSRPFDGLWL